MSQKYDVVVIGAGMGGLVCALYLVKNGCKVLIIEKNDKAGGYCTSFEREGFRFDTAVHYLKGCRKGFPLGNLIDDFKLRDRISFNRINPSDTIITPDFELGIYNDIGETTEKFADIFPKNKTEINNFLQFVAAGNVLELLVKTKGKSFNTLLEKFFNDRKLKTVFEMFLGNLGLPSSRVSATSACVFYRELLLDAGYYPKGGIQAFTGILVSTLKEKGGEILFSKIVRKITVKDKKVEGVELNTGEFIKSRFIVANCDLTMLFNDLTDNKDIKEESSFVNKLTPSISAFIVYISLKGNLKKELTHKGSIWFCPSYDVEEYYRKLYRCDLFQKNGYVVVGFPSFFDSDMAPENCESISLFMGAPFMNEEFWNDIRNDVEKEVIRRAEKVISGLKKRILFTINATPVTLHRYTFNREGAMYGWASTVDQVECAIISKRSRLKNLYFAGHWAGQGFGHGGVSMAAHSGFTVAKRVMKEMYKQNE